MHPEKLHMYLQIILDLAMMLSYWLTLSFLQSFRWIPPLEGWLLGDNGYPLRTWLITPYLMPTIVRDLSFNRKHMKTRSVIERTFGLLKIHFRCLDKSGETLQYRSQHSLWHVLCCTILPCVMDVT